MPEKFKLTRVELRKKEKIDKRTRDIAELKSGMAELKSGLVELANVVRGREKEGETT